MYASFAISTIIFTCYLSERIVYAQNSPCDYANDMSTFVGETILPIDAENQVDTLDFYDSYCVVNDGIAWKKGVADGTLTQDELPDGADEIDYQLFFCLFGLYDVGYVLLDETDASPLDCDSGVTIGGGIDLGDLEREDISSLNASYLPNGTLSDFDPFFGLKDLDATQALCDYGTLNDTINLNQSYQLTLDLIENKYLNEIAERYDASCCDGDDSTNSSFSSLTKGVKTVITVLYYLNGNNLFDYDVWDELVNQEYSDAVTSLSTFTSLIGCYVDDVLYQYLANILSASTECTSAVDIVFLIDGSGSISRQDFRKSLNFIVDIIENYDEEDISSGGVRFGVSQFSTDYQTEFYLNEYINDTSGKKGANGITDAVKDIEQLEEATKLGAAMEALASDQFNETKGMRSDEQYVPRVAIIMTDGLSSDGVNSELLEDKDVTIVVIGIGDYDIDQLNEISDNIYLLDDFDELTSHSTESWLDFPCLSSEISPNPG